MDPQESEAASQRVSSAPSARVQRHVSARPPTSRAQTRSVQSAKKGQRATSVRSVQQGRPIRSERSTLKAPHGGPAPSVRAAGTGRSGSSKPVGTEPAKEEVIKRAEERAKVPERFRDSLKRFFCSPTGMLKILRLGLIIGALACFIIVQAHESYIAITVLEICIVIFFILTYMLTLHHLLTCLHWPLLDLINSFITAVFLLVVAIFTMQERNRRHLFYVGGTLCLTAAIVCLLDAFVVTKTMRSTVKRLLKVTIKTNKPEEQLSFRDRSRMHVSLPPDTHNAQN